jgi:hypothetical protein
MSELGPAAWPPAPDQDRAARAPRARGPGPRGVHRSVRLAGGGYLHRRPRPRDELERVVPEAPRRRPGLFVVDLDGAMIGMVTLDRREAERPITSVPVPGRPNSPACSYPRRGDADMPPRRAQRHSAGSQARFPASRCSLHPRPPTTAPCVWRRSWGSPTWNGLRIRRRAVVRRVVRSHGVRLSSCQLPVDDVRIR